MKNELQREQGKSAMGRGKKKPPEGEKQEWIRECKKMANSQVFPSWTDYYNLFKKLGYIKKEREEQ